MKVYGLNIGGTGLEFSSREDRDKAIVTFTHSSTVQVSDTGIRYRDDKGAFGTYERDTKEQMANCYVCNGVFSTETCSERTYPQKASWQKEYTDNTAFICDACLARQMRDKEVFDAKKTLGQEL